MFCYQLREGAQLRVVEEQDAVAIYALLDRNREFLREWLPFIDHTQSAQGVLSFIRNARQQLANNQGTQYVILWQGQVAGLIGFHSIDWSNRKTSIGYWLGQEFTGLGLMSTAVEGLCQLAFEHYKLHCVEIRVATENTKSQRVPERLGFTREGVLRQREWLYDHYVDHIVYSMLDHEWKKS